MKKLTFILLLVTVISTFSLAQTTRIIGGDTINIKQAPWQIFLRNKNDSTKNCGGCIIEKNYILTAKHCAEKENTSDITVIAGFSCRSKITAYNEYAVEEIILHSDLDAALLKLSRNIVFDEKQNKISYIESLDTALYSPGNNVRVSGWGSIKQGVFKPAPCLKAVNLRMISNEKANEIFKNVPNHKRLLTENECAAKGSGFGRIGGCHGDSGGPLTTWSEALNKHILLGTVSWGRTGCMGTNKDSPSVFLRVSKLTNWIMQNVCCITGADTICNQATFTIKNFPEEAIVTWKTDENKLQIIAGQNTGCATFKRVGIGKCKIEAFFGGSSRQIQKEVVVKGIPTASEINISTNRQLSEKLPQDFLLANFNFDFVSCYQDEVSTLYASVPNILWASSIFDIPHNNNGTATQPLGYEWRIKSGSENWSIDPITINNNAGLTLSPHSFVFVTCNPTMVYPISELPPPPVIEVRLHNSCGISEWKEVSGFNVKNCDDYGAYHVLTPNGDGVNDTFEINIPEKTTKKTSYSVTFKLTILNEKGEVVYQKNSYMKDRERFKGVGNKGKKAAVCLPAGIYSYTFEGYKKHFGHIYIQRKQ